MKKLLYFIPFLFTVNAFSDSITSGVGFLKPATGSVDTTRSWADKLNSNFDILGSTLDAMNTRVNNLDTSSGSINDRISATCAVITARFDAVATDTNTLRLATGTLATIGQALAVDTNTLRTATGTLVDVDEALSLATASLAGGGTYYIQNSSTSMSGVFSITSGTVSGVLTAINGFVGGYSTFTSLNAMKLEANDNVFIGTNVPIAMFQGSTSNIVSSDFIYLLFSSGSTQNYVLTPTSFTLNVSTFWMPSGKAFMVVGSTVNYNATRAWFGDGTDDVSKWYNLNPTILVNENAAILQVWRNSNAHSQVVLSLTGATSDVAHFGVTSVGTLGGLTLMGSGQDIMGLKATSVLIGSGCAATAPGGTLGVKGNAGIGTNLYTFSPPQNGAIIEGSVLIGTSVVRAMLTISTPSVLPMLSITTGTYPSGVIFEVNRTSAIFNVPVWLSSFSFMNRDIFGEINSATTDYKSFATTATIKIDRYDLFVDTAPGILDALRLATASLMGGATYYIKHSSGVTGGVFYVSSGTTSGTITAIGGFIGGNSTFTKLYGNGSGLTGISASGGQETYSFIISTDSDVDADYYGTDQTPFSDAIAAMGTSSGTIRVRAGEYTFTSLLMVPETIELSFEKGARICQTGNISVMSCSGTISGDVVFQPLSTWYSTFYLQIGENGRASGVTFKDGSIGDLGSYVVGLPWTLVLLSSRNAQFRNFQFINNIMGGTANGSNRIVSVEKCIGFLVENGMVKDSNDFGPSFKTAYSENGTLKNIVVESHNIDYIIGPNSTLGHRNILWQNFKITGDFLTTGYIVIEGGGLDITYDNLYIRPNTAAPTTSRAIGNTGEVSSGTIIMNCTFDNIATGIKIESSCSNFYVHGNSIIGAVTAGITDGGSNTHLQDNFVNGAILANK